MAGILKGVIQNAQGLQGIAAIQQQMKQQQQDQERLKLGTEALNRYRETAQAGNPDNNAMTTALIYNADAAKNVLAHVGIQDQQQKRDAANFVIRAASMANNPEQLVKMIDSRDAYLVAGNRDPAHSRQLKEMILAGDLAGAKTQLKGVAAALVGDGSLEKSAYEMVYGKAPETMDEYQKATIALRQQELAAQQSRQAQDNSYYTFGQTAGGIVRQNARTGAIERVTDAQGNPIIGAAADPTLQGKITEAEKTGAFNAERVSETKKALKMNDQVLQYTKTAEDLLPKATGSGVGAAVDAAGRLVGVSSKSSEAAAKLKTLSGWLVSNVPRMEGPQSNVDVQNYQKMAGDIGNDRLTIEERMASLNALKQLISSQKELNSQVLSGKMQSVYDPNYQPPAAPAQGGSKYKIEVVQ